MIEPQYVYRATMLPILRQARTDGDTFWMDLDLGLRTHVFTKIRLRDYNAPELDAPGGREAKDRALALLYAAKQIFVRTFPDRMTRDRWEGEVWIDGESLGPRLAEEGHATHAPARRMTTGDFERLVQLRCAEFEREARLLHAAALPE